MQIKPTRKLLQWARLVKILYYHLCSTFVLISNQLKLDSMLWLPGFIYLSCRELWWLPMCFHTAPYCGCHDWQASRAESLPGASWLAGGRGFVKAVNMSGTDEHIDESIHLWTLTCVLSILTKSRDTACALETVHYICHWYGVDNSN